MASQSDNAITFSFDSPNSTISDADLRTAVNVPGNLDYEAPDDSVPPALETKVEDTKQEVEKPTTDPPSAQKPTEDLKTYKVKVNGEELTVTEADLLSGHMRHKDYTQKTQQIAEQQRQWEAKEAEYQRELQAIDQFLRDKQAISAYTQKVFGVDTSAPPQAVPQIDTTRPLSVQDVAKIAAYNAEEVRRSMAAEFEAKLQAQNEEHSQRVQQANAAVQRKELAGALDTHVSALLKQHPILTKFEDITEDLMGDATKRLPSGATLEDAKAQLTAAAERRVAVLQSITADNKKTSAVQAAKLKNNSIEPPGGSPVSSNQGKKLTLNTNDRKDFLAAAAADVQAFVDANS